MNCIADESVDGAIVESLRINGHNVIYVAELDPGLDDDEIFRGANDSGAILVTADKDFGEIVFRQKRVSNGVLLIRLAGLMAETKAELVLTVVREHESDLFQNFTVITPGIVRIRRSAP